VYQSSSVAEDIHQKNTEVGYGHAWRKEGSLHRAVLESAPQGKIPHRRPSLKWEDRIKENVVKMRPGTN